MPSPRRKDAKSKGVKAWAFASPYFGIDVLSIRKSLKDVPIRHEFEGGQGGHCIPVIVTADTESQLYVAFEELPHPPLTKCDAEEVALNGDGLCNDCANAEDQDSD